MTRELVRQAIEGPNVWLGSELTEDRWLLELTDDDVAELEDLVTRAKHRGLDLPWGNPGDAALRSLGPRLDDAMQDWDRGVGVLVVRGLPALRWSLHELRLAYWILGLNIGTPLTQDRDHSVLVDVRNDGVQWAGRARGYLTDAALPYHCDFSDLVGLLCVRAAKRGGLSTLVSSAAIHNLILAERPDLLEVLYQPFHFDRRDDQLPGEPPTKALPAFHHDGELFWCWYGRTIMQRASRHDGIPPLTPEQVEALDLVDEVANRPGVALHQDLRPGDLQLLNNWTVLHARTPFEDGEDESERRYLLRIWIRPRHGRRVPPAFDTSYGGQGHPFDQVAAHRDRPGWTG